MQAPHDSPLTGGNALSGDFLRDRDLYQAYQSLDLLRRALLKLAGGGGGDPSNHQQGWGSSAFDVPLGQLDWDSNGVAEIAVYMAPGPMTPMEGAAYWVEQAAEKLDDAVRITRGTWQGAAAEVMRAYTAVVKGNCEALKNELEQMGKDLGADAVEQGDSAAQAMGKLTAAVNKQASAVATSTSAAANTVLYDSPTSADYPAAQQKVETEALTMAGYIQDRINEIPGKVLTLVEKHNAPTVEIRDPRQSAPAEMEGFEFQEYGIVQAMTEVAEAEAQLHKAKEDMERAAAPPDEVFGVSAYGMDVVNAWAASVHLRIGDLGDCVKQVHGIYANLEETLNAYRHNEWKTQRELQKILNEEFERRIYDRMSGDALPSGASGDEIDVRRQQEALDSGRWDGSGPPPEGGDPRLGDGGGEGGGEGGGGGGVGGGEEE